MKLSIITVTYNDTKRLLKTIENVSKEIMKSKHKNLVEYLIKDGGSKDIDTINLPDGINAKLVVKDDNGIYSAMNQAVEIANGEYVIFINAGDYLYDGSIDLILEKLGKAEILAFNFMKSEKLYQQPKMNGIFLHRSLCHQSIVSKRSITRFSESYKLSSDYKFLLDHRDKICWIDDVISIYGDEFKPATRQNLIYMEKIEILKESKITFIRKWMTLFKLYRKVY